MVFTYEMNDDRYIEGCGLNFKVRIAREYGFPGEYDAGKAKLEIGKNLLRMIALEDTLSYFNCGEGNSHLDAKTGSLFSGSLTRMTAHFGNFGISVWLSTERYRKPQSDGTYSKLELALAPTGESSRPIMQSDLVKKMTEYVDHYQFRPQPKAEGELVLAPVS